jgi:hypothetical protein
LSSHKRPSHPVLSRLGPVGLVLIAALAVLGISAPAALAAPAPAAALSAPAAAPVASNALFAPAASSKVDPYQPTAAEIQAGIAASKAAVAKAAPAIARAKAQLAQATTQLTRAEAAKQTKAGVTLAAQVTLAKAKLAVSQAKAQLAAAVAQSYTYTYQWFPSGDPEHCNYNYKDYDNTHWEVQTRHPDNAVRVIRGGAWGKEKMTQNWYYENTKGQNLQKGYPKWKFNHTKKSFQSPFMWHGRFMPPNGHWRNAVVTMHRDGGVLPVCGASTHIWNTWGSPTP